MSSPFILHNEPDWQAAAQDLVSGLIALPTGEQRVELLENISRGLGNQLYPAFLQILHLIGSNARPRCQQIVAETLVDCLLSGRLPSGTLAAWGASTQSGDTAFGQSRTLGPIEYLCSWYTQPNQQTPLEQGQFSRALQSLLDLVAADPNARQLYARKLQEDALDALGGSWSSKARAGLSALATSWNSDVASIQVVDAFLHELQSESLLDQIARGRPAGL